MKKIGRLILYILVGSFVFIQFFRVKMNTTEEISANDFLLVHSDIPTELHDVFKTSCYDCHSNNTNYPWYGYVAPFSWVLDQHIRNGKHELNFSEYDTLSSRKKIAILDEICEVVSDSSMPPSNYLMLHSDAILSEEDKAMLCDWAEKEALALLRRK
jgi:hypothetical protein